MASNPTMSPDQAGVAQHGRTSDLMLIEIAKLQSDSEYVKRDLGDLRSDMRDVRGDIRNLQDRMTRLEERVAHLPGKGFIVAVVSTAVGLAGGYTTVAPRLQAATVSTQAPPGPSPIR